ncbi:hypothetical protein BT93_B0555 [Corymbia citriodora subsp. variegata]|nr:hypothetical protein BT93_B0555 [Corymbia citriodora subsp. variegata]
MFKPVDSAWRVGERNTMSFCRRSHHLRLFTFWGVCDLENEGASFVCQIVSENL